MRKLTAFIPFFLALYPLLNMVAHLLAVSYFAFIKLRAGEFVYDLRFYS
ncbi:MAG: hypothetical protein ACLFUB_18300 [Cyclobacteriaceae bacterium]